MSILHSICIKVGISTSIRNALLAKLELPDDPVAHAAWDLLNRSLHRWYGRYLVEKGIRTWDEYKSTWMDLAIHY
jgi:hypothetical protein